MLNPLSRKRGLACRAFALSFASFSVTCFIAQQPAIAQAPAQADRASAAVPERAPAWLAASYRSLIAVPLPDNSALKGAPASPSAAPSVIPQMELVADPTGDMGIYQPAGPTETSHNAFFQPLGTNGRSCATCHETASAMGLSVASIQRRFLETAGTDPVFAPVDGADCPLHAGSPMQNPWNYSLLLTRGLFRIALPVPRDAQFTVSVVSDPYGCNTHAPYNQSTNPTTGVTSQIVSVYRRSMAASNLKFKVDSAANTGQVAAVDSVTGEPLAIDPETGQLENGNIMSDGREPTLSSQATDATLGHAQATTAPTAGQVAQIVAFESGIYSAQYSDLKVGGLSTDGATGGPLSLSSSPAGLLAATGQQVVNAYDAWNPAEVKESAQRASIYRGQQIFNNLIFNVSNDAGINNIPGVPKSLPLTCSGCHGQVNGTTEPHPVGQHTIGIGGIDAAFGGPAPSNDLPIFKVVCKAGYATPFNGSVVLTNDPGKALITGNCADIGRFTTSPLRGLAARAPYFSDGSAATLTDVVNFYNKRFNIGLTAQNIQDLVNFLNTL